jgi:1,4-dihydroxy-6-naphthoate synthase
MSLAQELDPSVAEAHIALYVNDFTVELGEEGRACAQELLGRAEAAGLVPATDRDLLRDC